MPFEVFDKRLAAVHGQAYLSIQKKGVLALNHAAFAALGDPEAVELLFDRERQVVGVRAVDRRAARAYPVRLNTRGTTHLVSGAAFTKHYGIDTATTRRWRAYMSDGVLCVDVNEAPVS